MKHTYSLSFCIAGAMLAGGALAQAAPLRAPALPRHAQMKAQKLGDSRWDNSDGHDLREVACEGELRVAVVLVNFADVKFSVSLDPRQTIDDMLNEPGFSFQGADGSVFDYYQAQSGGRFAPRFDVYGPVQLDSKEIDYVKTTDTYTDPETGKKVDVYAPGKMVAEAVGKLDGEVDFSRYDSNGDGMVDFVYFFFPGKGATTGGSVASTIWPHAYTLTAAIGAPVEVDGVKVNRYATSSELNRTNTLGGIGMFCHEFAHVLGLPDLYDTANNNGTASKCFSPGDYSCMDAGNYLNDEHTPPLFSSYERYALEWMKPETITGGGRFTLLPLSGREFAYKVEVPGRPQEYFLLESRGAGMWDRFLPQRGLAVWHIDYDADLWTSNSPNNIPSHQHIDLIEADDDQTAGSRAGDLFPGAGDICEFRSNVAPSFTAWDNRPVGYELEGIRRHKDGCVEFKVTAADGKIMPGAEGHRSLLPRVAKAAPGNVVLEWNAVDEAEGYLLSVYPLKDFDGDFITVWLDGYHYHDCGTETSAVVEGMEPGMEYGAVVYALTPTNAFREEFAGVLMAGDSPETVRPYLRGKRESSGDVSFEWDEVAGASLYGLKVGTYGEPAGAMVVKEGFDGGRLPEGWAGNGKFESRANYVGDAAPSYNFNSGAAFLRSPRFDGCVTEISFNARSRFNDPDNGVLLSIYSVGEKGELRHLGDLTEMRNSMASCSFTVAIPEDVHQIEFRYTFMATGQDLYLDDLSFTLADELPFDTVAYVESTHPTAVVSGLDPASAYVAVAGVIDNGVFRQATFPARIVPVELPESGVGELRPSAAEGMFHISNGVVSSLREDVAFSIFTLDGRCVARDLHGSYRLGARGAYIVRSADGRAARVIW